MAATDLPLDFTEDTNNLDPEAFPWEPHQLEWLEALESGEYGQTRRRLRDEDGFCCLGVYLDRQDANRWFYDPERDVPYSWEGGECDAAGMSATTVLPDDEWRRLRLRNENGGLDMDLFCHEEDRAKVCADLGLAPNNVNMAQLSALNDYGWNLTDIAGCIRRNPYAVFTTAGIARALREGACPEAIQ